LTSNPAPGVAYADVTVPLQRSSSIQSNTTQVDRTDVALDISIASFKTIKEAAEAISQFGGPIKATCGIMILVLEAVKMCKNNREGWRELAEIMEDKNQSVISLLELYGQAPEENERILKQANKYQKILDEIAWDMKKETESDSEKGSVLENYWDKTKGHGREMTLSKINAQKIARYRERL
ncbi:10353_t:CDS:2, partial [Acaulospora colombiana]